MFLCPSCSMYASYPDSCPPHRELVLRVRLGDLTSIKPVEARNGASWSLESQDVPCELCKRPHHKLPCLKHKGNGAALPFEEAARLLDHSLVRLEVGPCVEALEALAQAVEATPSTVSARIDEEMPGNPDVARRWVMSLDCLLAGTVAKVQLDLMRGGTFEVSWRRLFPSSGSFGKLICP